MSSWLEWIFSDDHGYGNNGGSNYIDVQVQMESDERIAKELQEMESLYIDSCSDEGSDYHWGYLGSPSVPGMSSTPYYEDEMQRQDQVDPDHMTYEDLRSLEENVGSESKGLSDAAIASLSTSKFKSGFLTKKWTINDCVMCQSAFEINEKVITLPCRHYFHSNCIAEWLKINKTCPVCKEEVRGR